MAEQNLTKLGGSNPFAQSINQNIDQNRSNTNQSVPGFMTRRTTRGTVLVPIQKRQEEVTGGVGGGGGTSQSSVCRWAG